MSSSQENKPRTIRDALGLQEGAQAFLTNPNVSDGDKQSFLVKANQFNTIVQGTPPTTQDPLDTPLTPAAVALLEELEKMVVGDGSRPKN